MQKMGYDDLLSHRIKGRVLFNEPMRDHTTFKIGGPADILIVPRDLEDIRKCIVCAKDKGVALTVIGNGSKILVGDKGIRGIVIKLSGTLNHIRISGEKVISGAGCSISKLIEKATRYSLSGLEFAAGIPGTLGGAIAMNAGTRLGSFGDVVSNVRAVDIENNVLMTLVAKDCDFHYRGSVFQHSRKIIVEAELRLIPGDKDEMKRRVKDFLTRRSGTQPLDKPNAGSIFRNPPRLIAAKLMDSAGLKGVKIGDAQISQKHANFIVNLGNAKAQHVYDLMRLAQRTVKVKYGVDLIPELITMGEW